MLDFANYVLCRAEARKVLRRNLKKERKMSVGKIKAALVVLAGFGLCSVSANAAQGDFSSEGRCSCSRSWDCLSRVGECAVQEAIQKANLICEGVDHAQQVGAFEYVDCSSVSEACTIARAKFRCLGW